MTTYDEYGVPVGAYSEPESLTTQAWRLARALYMYRIRPLAHGRLNAIKRAQWSFKRLFTLVNALVVTWWAVLYWGERGVFHGAIEDCHWDRWENWEAGANPHRLIFIADPQLIDPHTYPGRPWPLNPLTYKYTDLYLRRTYSRFQTILYPDTIFFLGDLFDGGREWSTRTTTSPEKQYHKYGDDFWMNEYRRFGDIFFKHWGDAGMAPRPGQPGRKLITSLPGNHDLGFARGVQVGVRDRFNAYFGDGNRIDIIANHTFISIDSVSLSALDQPNPHEVEALWRPTQSFLETAKSHKHRLIQRELRAQQGLPPYPGMQHTTIPLQDLARAEIPHANADHVSDFPSILLTHVPLYRAPGTPCGPLREHWPPTPQPPGHQALEIDDRNAIAVRGGYQYQNVLTRELSSSIAEKIGDVSFAFSGDDHDYCDVLHRGYTSAGGGIREITVKSVSWAMGVRRPGVVLVSLWNPVGSDGRSVREQGKGKTVQMKLCLLPDQIGVFLRYGVLFGVTVLLLLVRAVAVAMGVLRPSADELAETPLLPITMSPQDEKENQTSHSNRQQHVTPHSSNSSTSSDRTTTTTGTLQSRTRSTTTTSSIPPSTSTTPYTPPTPQHPTPLIQHAGFYPDDASTSVQEKHQARIYAESATPFKQKKKEKKKGFRLFWFELRSSLRTVVVFGGVLYLWLVWRG
ncbi:hypothetical protein T440DRAFT_482257 [Plenodomus tracheiphilus IPT5]|uniref:Uncharacterized protein n=1 Tax=Plenodomus tracheiphilus IPT5 TaxID=1408161 RepID=A0A6A7AU78_9PLEO|nr:hypothetical protein T440DRAFT_482257 [Plenodomus tracheiphilus IPT5]